MSGEKLPVKKSVELKGIAFDGGSGIKSVAISIDGGSTWTNTKLGDSLGRFSFREWRLNMTFAKPGKVLLMVRATSNKGEVQPMTATWNPAGYLRNVVETTPVIIA
jgi:hypothetical protein